MAFPKTRYLRIDKLIDEFKPLVDDGTIPLNAGVAISFLKEEEQMDVYIAFDGSSYKIDLVKAEMLKQYSLNATLNKDMIEAILSGRLTQKPPKETDNYKINKTILAQYFNAETTKEEINTVVEEALAMYFSSKAINDGK